MKRGKRSLIMALAAVASLHLAGPHMAAHADTGTAVSEISFLDRRLYELADAIIKTPIMERALNMAVMPFADLNGGGSDFGVYVSENLIVQFARSRRYSVMERALLNKILEEHRLSMLGLVDPATAKKIGKLLGVDCLVTGTYSGLHDRVKVNARVISTETGMIITASETVIPRSADVDSLLKRTVTGAPAAVALTDQGQSRQSAVLAQNDRSSTGPSPEPVRAAVLTDDASGDQVTVDLRSSRFHPVSLAVPGAHRGCTVALEDYRPREISIEPYYDGRGRKYGVLKLGVNRNNSFFFALDDIGGQRPVLYLDKNQNGDLTDDGGPIPNQASGKGALYAANLKLPFRMVNESITFPVYEVWVFLNEVYYRNNSTLCHYSRTQFKGIVRINGTDYIVVVADRGDNDGDFTNDGIYIDLDRNGKIDYKTEYLEPGSPIDINGRYYSYRVVW